MHVDALARPLPAHPVRARAAVAAAEKEIERLAISAPFDGLLEADAARLGNGRRCWQRRPFA